MCSVPHCIFHNAYWCDVNKATNRLERLVQLRKSITDRGKGGVTFSSIFVCITASSLSSH